MPGTRGRILLVMTDAESGRPPATGRGPSVGRVIGVLGLIMHCTFVAYLILVSGLVVPWYGLLVLFAIWLALLVLGVRWLRSSRPARAVAVPGIALLAWIGMLFMGVYLFGWTA